MVFRNRYNSDDDNPIRIVMFPVRIVRMRNCVKKVVQKQKVLHQPDVGLLRLFAPVLQVGHGGLEPPTK